MKIVHRSSAQGICTTRRYEWKQFGTITSESTKSVVRKRLYESGK
jgi:hypothetical protein